MLIETGNPQLFAGGVDRVVERVVEGELVDQGRHPDQIDGSVGGPGADVDALAAGAVRGRPTVAARQQPVAVVGHEGQRLVVHRGQRCW